MSRMQQPIDFTAMIRELQTTQADIRNQELARHAELMDFASNLSQQVGPMGTYGQANAQIQQVGQAAAHRINQGAVQQQGQGTQNLIDRGLFNTTIQQSVDRGIEDDRQRAHLENDESIARQRSGLLERQAGMQFQAGVNEIDTALSRQTQYPDPSLFANLISQAASQDPNRRQQISIGPGSSSYGAQAIQRGGGGGGGGGRTPASPASPSPAPPGNDRRIKRADTGDGTAGPSIASYGAPAGNVADPALGGRVLGPNVPADTTYQGQTGAGSPIYQSASGAITNAPGGPALSSYMQPGTGFITGDKGTHTANAGGVGPAETNTAPTPGESTGGTSGIGGGSNTINLVSSSGERKTVELQPGENASNTELWLRRYPGFTTEQAYNEIQGR